MFAPFYGIGITHNTVLKSKSKQEHVIVNMDAPCAHMSQKKTVDSIVFIGLQTCFRAAFFAI